MPFGGCLDPDDDGIFLMSLRVASIQSLRRQAPTRDRDFGFSAISSSSSRNTGQPFCATNSATGIPRFHDHGVRIYKRNMQRRRQPATKIALARRTHADGDNRRILCDDATMRDRRRTADSFGDATRILTLMPARAIPNTKQHCHAMIVVRIEDMRFTCLSD